MAAYLMYPKQPNCIYIYTGFWLATLLVSNAQEMFGLTREVEDIEKHPFLVKHYRPQGEVKTSDPTEVSALGRPLFPGMLYDCRKDSFIPGVTLWDKKLLTENIDIRLQPQTDLKFSSSDSLSSKSNLLDVSVSMKASFLGGLVEVGGSAKYLRDTTSSNQQSRITMYYSETSRFEQLTMTQLGNVIYPQVFDQKTATHVVTAVLYGAKAFMVFDRTFSEEEDKQKIEGELNVMVKKIPTFVIEGKGSVNLTEKEKEIVENIACTFHGDVRLDQNPTTYMEALDLYKNLPTLMKENPQNAVPIKVWLYPLYLLDAKAAQLEREIRTSLVSNIEAIMEGLEDAERTYNDLSENTLVNVFSDIKERLDSFQESFSIYKTVLLKAFGRVLPGIRGGEKEEKSLDDILKIHYDSPFNAGMLNQWLNDAKSELHVLTSYIKKLEGIKIVDSDSLNTILHDPDIDFVVCFTFTSLKYEDQLLENLKEFLKSDKFKELDVEKHTVSVEPVRKWFNNPDVIKKMRENLSHFRSFLEASKDEKSIHFIISAISDPSSPGCSIYLYENGNLVNRELQPVSKPPPPIVKNILEQTVSLKLQKSPTGETMQYRVEYKQEKADPEDDEQWLVINTAEEEFTLTGLESGKQYLIRYRIVSKMGVSESSDTATATPSSAQPVIVGGTVDNEVTFMTPSIFTIKIISIYFNEEVSGCLSAIQVFFNNGQMIKVGNTADANVKEFLFDDNDKIVAATLWPNKEKNRLSGLEFQVVKSDGPRTYSYKGADLGDPVVIDVKSGKCYGIIARGRDKLIALGFYFI